MAGDFRTVHHRRIHSLGLVVTAVFAAAITIWRRNADREPRGWILTGTSLLYAALTRLGACR